MRLMRRKEPILHPKTRCNGAGEGVGTRRSRYLRIPRSPIPIAVFLSLRNMKDFILRSESEKRVMPTFCRRNETRTR